jgi:hypothetical protein
MSIDDDLSNFDKEINELVDQIRTIFNTDASRWFLHEQTDTLYVEIKGIESYPESEVEALLTPIMDELELDFEEIILLPYTDS